MHKQAATLVAMHLCRKSALQFLQLAGCDANLQGVNLADATLV
jgi:hypothetical protein